MVATTRQSARRAAVASKNAVSSKDKAASLSTTNTITETEGCDFPVAVVVH